MRSFFWIKALNGTAISRFLSGLFIHPCCKQGMYPSRVFVYVVFRLPPNNNYERVHLNVLDVRHTRRTLGNFVLASNLT